LEVGKYACRLQKKMKVCQKNIPVEYRMSDKLRFLEFFDKFIHDSIDRVIQTLTNFAPQQQYIIWKRPILVLSVSLNEGPGLETSKLRIITSQ